MLRPVTMVAAPAVVFVLLVLSSPAVEAGEPLGFDMWNHQWLVGTEVKCQYHHNSEDPSSSYPTFCEGTAQVGGAWCVTGTDHSQYDIGWIEEDDVEHPEAEGEAAGGCEADGFET